MSKELDLRLRLVAKNKKELEKLLKLTDSDLIRHIKEIENENCINLFLELNQLAEKYEIEEMCNKANVISLRNKLLECGTRKEICVCDEYLLRFGGGNQNVGLSSDI